MGQHKYNETAKLAKEGKLPPKPIKKSKRELEREFYRYMQEYIPTNRKLAEVIAVSKILNKNNY